MQKSISITKTIPLSALAVTLNVQTSCLQSGQQTPGGKGGGWGLMWEGTKMTDMSLEEG